MINSQFAVVMIVVGAMLFVVGFVTDSLIFDGIGGFIAGFGIAGITER
jgi:hypothetical protein